MRATRFLRLVALVLLTLLVSVGCKGRSAATTDVVPLPVVADTSTDLLLTWIDEKGESHVEQKVADVPVGARDVVRVADPVKDPPQLDDIFVADLRNVGPAGTYVVRTMSRAEFEKIAVERRKQHGTVLTAQSAAAAGNADPSGANSAQAGAKTVIIYGASWCGPCHQAAAFLKQRNVPFIEKDIEQDGSAAREMQAKLSSAGMRGGSIPVLDVRGKLLVGFDQGAVERALTRSQ